jgi:hypothetical protein
MFTPSLQEKASLSSGRNSESILKMVKEGDHGDDEGWENHRDDENGGNTNAVDQQESDDPEHGPNISSTFEKEGQ